METYVCVIRFENAIKVYPFCVEDSEKIPFYIGETFLKPSNKDFLKEQYDFFRSIEVDLFRSKLILSVLVAYIPECLPEL